MIILIFIWTYSSRRIGEEMHIYWKSQYTKVYNKIGEVFTLKWNKYEAALIETFHRNERHSHTQRKAHFNWFLQPNSLKTEHLPLCDLKWKSRSIQLETSSQRETNFKGKLTSSLFVHSYFLWFIFQIDELLLLLLFRKWAHCQKKTINGKKAQVNTESRILFMFMWWNIINIVCVVTHLLPASIFRIRLLRILFAFSFFYVLCACAELSIVPLVLGWVNMSTSLHILHTSFQ